MNETTFIDLQETPEALPELPAGALNVRLLFSLALGALEVAGATPEAILTTYSDIPQLWDIPPRLANVGHIPVNVRIPDTGKSSAHLIDLHTELRALVRRCGVGDRVRQTLVETLGDKTRHPLVFLSSEPSREAADLFSVEFLIAVGNGRSNLKVQHNTMVRTFPGKRTVISQIKLNDRVSPGLQAEWVQERVFGPRGTIVYGTFDIFDRCLVWANQITPKEDTKNLRLALSWLKLVQDRELAYEFEQAVRRVEPFVAEPADLEYVELLYTHESLDYARDLWMNQEDKDDHTAFRDFYDYLVPTYLDDDQFRKLFKTGMVLKADFTDDIRRRIDAGMMNFAGWFLRMMRKYARK